MKIKQIRKMIADCDDDFDIYFVGHMPTGEQCVLCKPTKEESANSKGVVVVYSNEVVID